MTKGTKIWLWFAFVLSIATTAMNAAYGRILSVAIALVALAGLSILLFSQKKLGFFLMCICYMLAFIEGVHQSIIIDTSLFVSIVMSFIGSALIPLVTYAFLHKHWKELK